MNNCGGRYFPSGQSLINQSSPSDDICLLWHLFKSKISLMMKNRKRQACISQTTDRDVATNDGRIANLVKVPLILRRRRRRRGSDGRMESGWNMHGHFTLTFSLERPRIIRTTERRRQLQKDGRALKASDTVVSWNKSGYTSGECFSYAIQTANAKLGQQIFKSSPVRTRDGQESMVCSQAHRRITRRGCHLL